MNNLEKILSQFKDNVVALNEPDFALLETARQDGELEEYKSEIKRIFYDWDIGDSDFLSPAQATELKGILHSLKGVVATLGLYTAQKLTHRAESIIEYIEKEKIAFKFVKPIIEQEIDKIYYILENPQPSYNEDTNSRLNALHLDDILGQPIVEITTPSLAGEKEDVTNTNIVKKETVNSATPKQIMRVDSALIEDTINSVGEIRLGKYGSELLQESVKSMLLDVLTSTERLLELLRELELRADIQLQATNNSKSENAFDPLEMDRYTRLQELARFMTEPVNDIAKGVGYIENIINQQQEIIITQSNLAEEVIDNLLQTRVANLGLISDRFYKTVKNASEDVGKKVKFEIFGDEIPIDRAILDKVLDPIGHILRNCVSHGIETGQERLDAGKDPVGSIKLDVSTIGNRLAIAISDDGGGLNLERIKKKAIEKGLISADIEYTEDEIKDLIFESGFSTANQVTGLAGRGVGMDVVKREILALSGFIEVESVMGKGTKFILNLPMGVATTQSVILKRKEKIYAIPSLLITTVKNVDKKTLLGALEKNKINAFERDYELVYIGSLLGEQKDLVSLVRPSNQILLLESYGQFLALWVDKIESVNEIIIKPLGHYFNNVPGLIGATLMGDGSQGLVINPLEFNNVRSLLKANNEVDNVIVNKYVHKVALIVDDSFTIRNALNKWLVKYGYDTILAKNGEDALQKLREQKPSIILTDIEMPVMDGFTFVQNVRKLNEFTNVPIVMISSRSVDKYIEIAKSYGVNDFLGKPLTEDELITAVKNFEKN